jgi:membrane protease YdiL (CAAX protease family)
MKAWMNSQIFTYIALFVLLAIRIPIADLVSNFIQLLNMSAPPFYLESLRLIQDNTHSFYERWAFALIGIILIINRDRMININIDEVFITLFLVVSFVYCRYFFWPSGLLVASVSISMFLLYGKKEHKFVNVSPNAGRITLILIMLFLLRLLYLIHSPDITKYGWTLLHRAVLELPFITIEEVIFRGLLWMFLSDLRLPDLVIVVFQGILFWLSHAYYMFTYPLFFWVIIPIASILLGLIVWYSKSITASAIAHIFFNALR